VTSDHAQPHRNLTFTPVNTFYAAGMASAFHDLLAEKGTLVVDGAMGTQLFAVGLESGDPPEEWNISQPDKISQVHQRYVDAGSDIFLTNSFGGTRFRLKLHNFQDRVFELNKAAAEIGRRVADAAPRKILVAGSMGPSGELLEPMGEMTPQSAEDAFAEQAEGLAAGGADIIWVETMSDLGEITAAVKGAQKSCDLPVTVTLSFDTAGRSMMGVTGTAAAEALIPLGVAALGANCGNNLADTEAALAEMRAVHATIPLISKGNAGIPVWKGASLEYSGTPEVMAAHAHRVHGVGASIIGACCGSMPEHITYMAKVLNGELPPPEVQVPEGSANKPTPARRARGRRRS